MVTRIIAETKLFGKATVIANKEKTAICKKVAELTLKIT